jgi:hypothetical protein
VALPLPVGHRVVAFVAEHREVVQPIAQWGAARALLGWAQSELSEASGLPVTMIARPRPRRPRRAGRVSAH